MTRPPHRLDGTSPDHGLVQLCMGAWRPQPPTLGLSAEQLLPLLPNVLTAGLAGLAWHRIRGTALQDSAAGEQLHREYRIQVLSNECLRDDLVCAVDVLRRGGVEPVLIKGAAVATCYADPTLRPYGDIDLCVAPLQFEAAERLMATFSARQRVDLHRGFGQPEGCRDDECDFDARLARSRLLRIGGVEVRVLGVEDHLRLICRHMFIDAAWRPLWLTDVAAVLESIQDPFDWALCLGRSHRRSDWVACSIALAHQLLDARMDTSRVDQRVPRWLTPTLLQQWRRGSLGRNPQPIRMVNNPKELLQQLWYRWPRNRLDLASRWWGPLRTMPWARLVVADVISRTVRLLLGK